MPDNTRLRVADLPQNSATSFDLRPDAAQVQAHAQALDLLGLRKLRLTGEIVAHGRRDWLLTAQLGATVVQPCVVTLDPVTSRIDADVRRLYLADFTEPEAEETEMPEDESIEPLPAVIDLEAVLSEALALNLPLYPRKPDADLGEAVFTEAGKPAMRDEDTRPFAGLSVLKGNPDDDV